MRERAGSSWRALAAAIKIGRAPIVVGAMLAVVAASEVQSADVVLDDLRVGVGQVVYIAPRAEFRGTSLSKADLTSLLDPASPEPLAARVARLDANEIVLPELTSEITTPQGPQVTRYRGVVFTTVSGGTIASVTAAGGAIESHGPEGTSKGTFGRFALQDLDLGLAVSLFSDKAPGTVPLKRLYGTFSLDSLALVDPAGTATSVARISGRDLSARPIPDSWLGALTIVGANPDLKAASPEDRKRSFGAMADLFTAFELGGLEATGITFGPKDQEDGKGRIDRIAYQGATASRGADFSIEGFEAGSRDGRVRFASLALGGISVKTMMEGLRDLGTSASEAMSPAQIRKLFPVIGSAKLGRLEVELPSGELPRLSNPTATTRVSLAEAEINADKAVEGVPSDLRLAFRNLTFPIAPNPDNDGLKQLAGLGYERFGASLAANLGWNEAGQELVLREISLDGAEMGNLVLRGVVGNVSRDAFNPDSAIASVALLGATAKSLEIVLENRGLFERIIAREARRQKRNAEDIRREYGMAAAVGIPAILGSSAGAKVLAQAVARFVAKPGRLTLRAKAKQPGGYGVADFSAGPDPASVLEKIELTATAE